jgi:multicomponent Na+:H+ antiporter subunit D
MPLTMLAFTVGALSIVGLPPFGGAWSKWWLVQGTLDAELWLLTAVLLVSSLLNILYLLAIPLRGFFIAPAAGQNGVREAPLPSLLAMAVTVTGCLLLFFQGDAVYRLAGGMLQ